jgi:hypothetical protein
VSTFSAGSGAFAVASLSDVEPFSSLYFDDDVSSGAFLFWLHPAEQRERHGERDGELLRIHDARSIDTKPGNSFAADLSDGSRRVSDFAMRYLAANTLFARKL